MCAGGAWACSGGGGMACWGGGGACEGQVCGADTGSFPFVVREPPAGGGKSDSTRTRMISLPACAKNWCS